MTIVRFFEKLYSVNFVVQIMAGIDVYEDCKRLFAFWNY